MTTRRILVAYASRGGSTAGVAEAIGRTLAESGAQVEVRSMKSVASVDEYDSVVLGSAIRGGAWLPEAMQFLRTHQAALGRKPVAAFLVCITLAMPGGEQYRQSVSGWMKDARALVRPVSEACFAGAINYASVPLVPDGLKLGIMSAAMRVPPGDYRDWDAIRIWAAQLPRALGAASAQPGESFPVAASHPSLIA